MRNGGFWWLFPILLASPAFGAGANLKIVSKAGDFCMDAKGDKKADGTPVFMYKCHGHENQRWSVTESNDGKSAIVGVGGYCLDVRGAHSKKDGTPIQLWKCHFGDNQRFVVANDGHIKEAASGKCLMGTNEKDGAAIVLDECGSTKGELWSFKN